MTETDFLKGYDPRAFEPYAVTVDLVLMSIVEDTLVTLVMKRSQYPEKDKWALPGGFVGPREDLDTAAQRVLSEKTRIHETWLEQLYTFGAPDRDPRMRVISVAYFALLPANVFSEALKADANLTLAKLKVDWPGETGGPARIEIEGSGPTAIAFDHADILGVAIRRLRGKLNYTPVALALLPDRFTLRALQAVHEAILDTQFNKPAFRRRMLDSGMIEGTGEKEPPGGAYRPAELYQRKPQA